MRGGYAAPMNFTIRDVQPGDLPEVLRINQAARPAVSDSTPEKLAWFAEVATWFKVAQAPDGRLGGFLIGLGPGVDYDSLNYGWFTARYDNFLYVDRIALDESARGVGLGTRFYAELEAFGRGRSPWILCEVNTRPRNEVSLRFHERAGFDEVGTQDTEGGTKTVVMLRKAIR